MKYLIASFHIQCADNLAQIAKDLLADIAGEAGFESFEDTNQGLNGYVQETLIDQPTLDAGLQAFPIADVHITYTLSPAEDRDWNEQWEQQGFEPIHIASRIVVYDARSTQCPDIAPHEMPIAIEARQAFGTGTHETTRMVIGALIDAQPATKRVLDCGCGTGILSIAAALLGASSCIGYDIDEWSVDNTRHNAALNGVECLEALHGDIQVAEQITGTFDIVMANIHRNIILADMPRLVAKMAPGATLIVSGFYTTDIPLLCNRASECGLTHTATHSEEPWACLVFRKETS